MGESEKDTVNESESEETVSKDKTRREFIKLAGLGAGAVVAAKLLPDISDGSGGARAGVLGKPPPQPPSGTTNPVVHSAEVKINPNPLASNPTTPYKDCPTLEIITPNDVDYAKPALSISLAAAQSADGILFKDSTGTNRFRVTSGGVIKGSDIAGDTFDYVVHSKDKVVNALEQAGAPYSWEQIVNAIKKVTKEYTSGRGVVYIPEGLWNMDGMSYTKRTGGPTVKSLVIPCWVELVGAGKEKTRLKWTASPPQKDSHGIIFVDDYNNSVNDPASGYCGVRGMTIDGPERSASILCAIHGTDVFRFIMQDLMVRNWPNGIVLDSLGVNATYTGSIWNCEVCNIGSDVTATGIGLTGNMNHIQLEHSQVYNCTGTGIRGDVGYGPPGVILIDHCAVEVSDTGISFHTGKNITISNCYFEAIDTEVIALDGALYYGAYTPAYCCRITGNYGNLNGYSAVPVRLGDPNPSVPWNILNGGSGARFCLVENNFFWYLSTPPRLVGDCRGNVIRGNVFEDTTGHRLDWQVADLTVPPSYLERASDDYTEGGRSQIQLGGFEFLGGQLMLRLKTSAGAPDDASYGSGNGTIVWNSAENKLYVRGATGWKSALLS